MRELDPSKVAMRLAELRRLYVAERLEDGRVRLERERPELSATFDEAVARRLTELRALCELARHLHGGRFPVTMRGVDS